MLQRFAPLSLFVLSSAALAVPETFLYVGDLDEDGAPANGTFSVTFQMFDDVAAGTRVFEETVPSLLVVDGALVHELGAAASNPLDDAELAGDLYLAVVVNGTALEPRVPIRAVPFARDAALLEGLPASSYLSAGDLVGPDIGIADNGVTLAAIGPNSVDSSKVVNLSIAGADLADGSVATRVLAGGAVSGQKLKAKRFLIDRDRIFGGGLQVVNDVLGTDCDGSTCRYIESTAFCGISGGAARFFDCDSNCTLAASRSCEKRGDIVGFVAGVDQ